MQHNNLIAHEVHTEGINNAVCSLLENDVNCYKRFYQENAHDETEHGL